MTDSVLWDSTCAFTAYNSLALAGPMTLSAVVSAVQTVHSAEAPAQEQIELGLAGMMSRGWISFNGSTYALRDSERRIVKWRARSNDGWDDWKVEGLTGRRSRSHR